MSNTIVTAKLPATLPTDADFGGQAGNNAASPLTSPVAAGDLTLPVAELLNYPTEGTIWVGTERVHYTSKSAGSGAGNLVLTDLTGRGYDGSSAQAHVKGELAMLAITALERNRMRVEIEAIGGVLTGANPFLHGLTIKPAGVETALTLDLQDQVGATGVKWLDFQLGGVSKGYIGWDAAENDLDLVNLNLSIAAGSNLTLENNRALQFGDPTAASIRFNTSLGPTGEMDYTGAWDPKGGYSAVVYLDGNTAIARTASGVVLASGTNHATVIQAAWSAVPSTGGKVLHRAGTYSLNLALVPQNNLVVEGEGSRDPTGTGAGTTFFIANAANISAIAGPASDIRVEFRNFRIDGNRANQSATSKGITGSFSRSIIDNVALNNVRDTAIELLKTTFAFFVTVKDCFLNDCYGIGLDINGPDACIVESNYFNISSATPVDGNGTIAIRASANNEIRGNYIAKYNEGVKLVGNGSTVRGNRFDTLGKNPITATTGRQAIQNNVFFYSPSGPLADATYSGIQLAATSSDNVVTGNKFYQTAAQTTALRYCIQETAGSDYNLISDNHMLNDVGTTFTTLAVKISNAIVHSHVVDNTGGTTEYIPDGITINRGVTGIVSQVTQSTYAIFGAAGDANPTLKLATTGIALGAGGAVALDTFLFRQAANVLAASTNGSSVDGTFYSKTFRIKNQSTGADPTITASSSSQTASFAGNFNPATDDTFLLGTGGFGGAVQWNTINVRLAKFWVNASDANESFRISTSGVRWGAGGATPPDIFLSRQMAGSLELTDPTGTFTGDMRLSLLAAGNVRLSFRATPSDVNSFFFVDNTGFGFGPGGATTTDITLGRQSAGVLEQTSGNAGSVRFGVPTMNAPLVELRNNAADANPSAQLLKDRLNFGAGGASATDVSIQRTGGALLTITGTVTFAGNVLPDADNTRANGSSALRWASTSSVAFNVFNAAGDANVLYAVGASGFIGGAGGASATDFALARNGSSDLKLTGTLAGDVRWGMTGAATPRVSLRLATADAQHVAALLMDRIEFGAGGASAVDVDVRRTGANALQITASSGITITGDVLASSDAARSVGTATNRFLNNVANVHAVYGASADANPVWKASSSGTQYGAGGGTAVDVTVARQAASVLELTGTLAGSIRYGMSGAGTPFVALRAASGDANPTAQLLSASLAFGPGGATSVRTFLWEQAAQVLAVGSSGALIDGTFYARTLKIKNQGAGADPTLTANSASQTTSHAGNFFPGTTATFTLGNSSNLWSEIDTQLIKLFTTSGDANEAVRVSTSGVRWGAGGASAPDAQLTRQAASVVKLIDPSAALAGDVRIGLSATATPFVALRAATADANPLLQLKTDRIEIGPGGASAVDVDLRRTGANAVQLTASSGITITGDVLASSDAARSVGTATNRFLNNVANVHAVYGASADANPVWKASSSGTQYGAGGGTAVDVTVARQAASVLELTGTLAGSIRYGMSGANLPFLALRLISSDANEAVSLTSTGLNIGAGGASAVDVTLLRTGAAAVALTGQLTLNTGLTMADAKDIALGTGTGTKFGTGTTQKIGFYGVAPIAQRSGAAQAAVVGTASTQTVPWGYATQAQADAIVTLVNELRAWAVVQGFIKGSA